MQSPTVLNTTIIYEEKGVRWSSYGPLEMVDVYCHYVDEDPRLSRRPDCPLLEIWR